MISADFARSLVARYGSPLYAYDLDVVADRGRTLLSLLPQGAKLFYSLKANPNPAIVGTLRELGCQAEISSLGELSAGIEAGFAAEDLLFGGPGKTEGEMEQTLAAGVRYYSCESWTDLERIENAARRRSQSVKVLLRVNPSVAPQAKLAMSGVESQFGFEEPGLLAGAAKLKTLDAVVQIVGIHVYFGTQIGGVEALTASTRCALETIERISGQLGIDCRVANVGGGFPWPYATADAGPDLSGLRTALAEVVSQSKVARQAELWFESGRYLSASAGTLVATVLDIKESKSGKKYLVLDAGINQLGGMSGLGRIPRPLIALQRLPLRETEEMDTYDVVGPLCSPLDCLGRGIKLPRVAAGDLMAVPNVGAYGLTASLMGFLSHPPAAEVAFWGTRCVDARRRRWDYERLEV